METPCPACTFLNATGTPACVVCGCKLPSPTAGRTAPHHGAHAAPAPAPVAQPRPGAEASPGPARAGPRGPGSLWACAACTFANSAFLPACEMCGAPRTNTAPQARAPPSAERQPAHASAVTAAAAPGPGVERRASSSGPSFDVPEGWVRFDAPTSPTSPASAPAPAPHQAAQTGAPEASPSRRPSASRISSRQSSPRAPTAGAARPAGAPPMLTREEAATMAAPLRRPPSMPRNPAHLRTRSMPPGPTSPPCGRVGRPIPGLAGSVDAHRAFVSGPARVSGPGLRGSEAQPVRRSSDTSASSAESMDGGRGNSLVAALADAIEDSGSDDEAATGGVSSAAVVGLGDVFVVASGPAAAAAAPAPAPAPEALTLSQSLQSAGTGSSGATPHSNSAGASAGAGGPGRFDRADTHERRGSALSRGSGSSSTLSRSGSGFGAPPAYHAVVARPRRSSSTSAGAGAGGTRCAFCGAVNHAGRTSCARCNGRLEAAVHGGSARSHGHTWVCAACTTQNGGSDHACTACGSRRDATAQLGLHASRQPWVCPVCVMNNAAYAGECGICGSARPQADGHTGAALHPSVLRTSRSGTLDGQGSSSSGGSRGQRAALQPAWLAQDPVAARKQCKPHMLKIKGSKAAATLHTAQTLCAADVPLETRTQELSGETKTMKRLLRCVLCGHVQTRHAALSIVLELVTSQDAGVTAQLFVESGLLPVIAVLMADTKTTKTKGFFNRTVKLPPVTSAELPYVLKILRAMAEVNRPAMAHSPALLTVLVKFIRHSNPEAQLLALQALCSSTKYADDWEAATMLQVGAVEAVVVRLVDEAAHPDVLAIALVAATNMSEKGHLARALCRAGAMAKVSAMIASVMPAVSHNMGLLVNRLAFTAASEEGVADVVVPVVRPAIMDMLGRIQRDALAVASALQTAVQPATVNLSMAMFNLSALPKLRGDTAFSASIMERLIDIVSVSTGTVQALCLRALVNFTVDCDERGYAVFVSSTGLSCMLELLSRRPPLTRLYGPLTELYANAVQQDAVAVAFASHDGLAQLQHVVMAGVSNASLSNLAAIFCKLSSPNLAAEVVDRMVEFDSFDVLLTLCVSRSVTAREGAMQALDNFATHAARPVNGVPVGEYMAEAGAVTCCVECVTSDASVTLKVHAMQTLAKLAQASAKARTALTSEGRCKALLALARSDNHALRLSVGLMLQRLVHDQSLHPTLLEAATPTVLPPLLADDDLRTAMAAARALDALILSRPTLDALVSMGLFVRLLQQVAAAAVAQAGVDVADAAKVAVSASLRIRHSPVVAAVLDVVASVCQHSPRMQDVVCTSYLPALHATLIAPKCTSEVAGAVAGVLLRAAVKLPVPLPRSTMTTLLDDAARLLSWSGTIEPESRSKSPADLGVSPLLAALGPPPSDTARQPTAAGAGGAGAGAGAGATAHGDGRVRGTRPARAAGRGVSRVRSRRRLSNGSSCAGVTGPAAVARRRGAGLLLSLGATEEGCRVISTSTCMAPLLAMLGTGYGDDSDAAARVVARLARVPDLAWVQSLDEVAKLPATSPARQHLGEAAGRGTAAVDDEDVRMRQAQMRELVNNMDNFDTEYYMRRQSQEAQFRQCALEHLDVANEPLAAGASAQVFVVRVRVSGDSPFDGSVQGRQFALKKLKDWGATAEDRAAQMAKDFAIPRRYPNMFIIHCLAQFDAETIRCDELERELGTGTTSYVVMSLANKTLAQFVEERPPLPERHVLLLLLQLASAIAHLNRHNVAHRDIKLDNIVITSMGKVMLIDFGEACETLMPTYGAGNAQNRPPEVINAVSGPYNYTKADVWSIGCLAYEMVKQPHPWASSSDGLDILSTKKHSAADVANLKPPRLPAGYPHLQLFVDAVLNPVVDKRPSTSAAVGLLRQQLWPLPPKKEHALAQLHTWVAQMNNSVREFLSAAGNVRFRNIEEYMYAHMLIATLAGIDPHMQRGRLAGIANGRGEPDATTTVKAVHGGGGSGWHGPGAEAEQAFLEEDADDSDL